MTTPSFGEQPQALGLADAQVEVTPWFREQLRAALGETFQTVPDKFVSWMVDKNAMFGLPLPIGQVIGFAQFTAQVAPLIVAGETTTSTVYGDLTTPGPSLTGLPDGRYLVLWGCLSSSSVAGDDANMHIQLNSTAPTNDQDAAVNDSDRLISVVSFMAVTLSSGGNNTITAKYRTNNGASTATFRNRRMLALRYANI